MWNESGGGGGGGGPGLNLQSQWDVSEHVWYRQ